MKSDARLQNWKRSLTNRNITYYFRGGLLHGVDCKKKGTWVRREAFEAFGDIRGAVVTATEDVSKFTAQDGLVDAEITERQRRRARVPNYSSANYANELLRSDYCLHLRGDTTTSRRLFDSIAAGCVPVIVSDGCHLPFKSQLDWKAFTVTISEDELMEESARIARYIVEDKAMLKKKQEALEKARKDLLYGFGSPLDNATMAKREFRLVDHLLQQSFELAAVDGRYRRFPGTFEDCTLVQTLWKDDDSKKREGGL